MKKESAKAVAKAPVKEKVAREPLFHVAKRAVLPFWKRATIRVIAVVIAILTCFLFAWVFGDISPVKLVSSMTEGAFGTNRSQWKTIATLSRLLGIALALTPAFVMKFWNIGGEGQVLVGALASVACAVEYGGKISEPLLLLMMLAAALLAGAIWGFIPALFKALWNSNETLFTLMMNYIAIQLVAFMLAIWEPKDNTLDEMQFGHLNFFPFYENFGDELTLTVVILVVAIFMYVYLRFSKHGYEISVVGESENTARYIGISVKKVTIRTMILSGLLCGLVGFLIVSIFDHSITGDLAGGYGFTAIMVSWMAKFNPLVMIGTAGIIAFLEVGADRVVTDVSSVKVDNFLTRSMGENAPEGISPDFPGILVGIILFFIVGCEFFINYELKFRKKAPKLEGKENQK